MLRDAFKAYLELEKNYSPHTVTAYTRDLDFFREFMMDAYEFDPTDTDELDGVTHRMIRSWMGEMLENGISKRSVARKIASLNHWFRWLLKTEKIESNPARKVTVPKYEQKLPAFLKEQSIENLFENVEYPDNFEGKRDRAILEIFYSCGLRRSELIGLQFVDINFPGRTIKVMGKGRKERVIPFGRPAELAMQAYIDCAEGQGVNFRGAFFVKEKDSKPLSTGKVHSIVERYLKQACTLSKTSPHVLRHTFATHLLNNGADLNAIKELLGHTSLAATQVYVHNSIQKLKKVYKQAHPKA